MSTVLTFGHGTAGADELVALLRDADVELVVDVRRFPGSRRHPHVATAELERWLPASGISYRWDAGLGGRRRLPADERDADPWWRVEAFRAYAAYTRTPDFGAALRRLLDDAGGRPEASVAIMCSETLWWRCHRRIISDVLVLLHDCAVLHLGHDGRTTPHEPAAGARVAGDGLRYDLDEV